MAKIEHTGEHMESVCEKCFDYRQSWSHVAGQNGALLGVVELLEKRAAEAFIQRDHVLANDRLRLADEVGQLQKETSKRLQAYIDGRRGEV